MRVGSRENREGSWLYFEHRENMGNAMQKSKVLQGIKYH